MSVKVRISFREKTRYIHMEMVQTICNRHSIFFHTGQRMKRCVTRQEMNSEIGEREKERRSTRKDGMKGIVGEK